MCSKRSIRSCLQAHHAAECRGRCAAEFRDRSRLKHPTEGAAASSHLDEAPPEVHQHHEGSSDGKHTRHRVAGHKAREESRLCQEERVKYAA